MLSTLRPQPPLPPLMLIDLHEPEPRPPTPLMSKSRKCLEEGSVQLSQEGQGGTYFLINKHHKYTAVLKIADEEPGAPNNPKLPPDFNPLLPPGGGYLREIAAWLLDNKRAGVPETLLLSNFNHPNSKENIFIPKHGSLQKYVPNIGTAESFSSSLFLTSDVHNIGILDLRMFNMDRNLENILVTTQMGENCSVVYRLVPIDHAFSLPPNLSLALFEWLYWDQSKIPFTKETLDFIANIDLHRDASILYALGITQECIRTMEISTRWLQCAAEAGLNLFQIGYLACRLRPSKPSFLELVVAKAEKTSESQGNSFIVVLDKMFRDIVNTFIHESIPLTDLQNFI